MHHQDRNIARTGFTSAPSAAKPRPVPRATFNGLRVAVVLFVVPAAALLALHFAGVTV